MLYVRFDDNCNLQPIFDHKHPPLFLQHPELEAKSVPRIADTITHHVSVDHDRHSGSNSHATASPSSLQQLSLACLALHLSDLIQMGPSVFSYMHTPHKQSLMVVARRQGLLKPGFTSLYDPDFPILDVHQFDNDNNDDDRLELSELLHALEISSQNLRMIDIRGYTLTARLIHSVANCTRLEVLRIGGTSTTNNSTRDGVAAAVKRILPDKHHMPVIECWEDNHNDVSIKGYSRLWQLQCLVWDEMPSSLETFVILNCPGLRVNPSKMDTSSGGLEYDVDCDLDMPYIEEIAGGDERWGRGRRSGMCGEQQPEKELHIAEKFKRAWEERLAKLAKLEEKKIKKERVARRKELEKSPSAMMITRWELEEI